MTCYPLPQKLILDNLKYVIDKWITNILIDKALLYYVLKDMYYLLGEIICNLNYAVGVGFMTLINMMLNMIIFIALSRSTIFTFREEADDDDDCGDKYADHVCV